MEINETKQLINALNRLCDNDNTYEIEHKSERAEEDELLEEEQLQLLATNGMLVKRPLVVDGDTVLVGFKEAEWSEKLN